MCVVLGIKSRASCTLGKHSASVHRVSVGGFVHALAAAHGAQKHQIFQELKTREDGKHLMWMLGDELESSARAMHTCNA